MLHSDESGTVVQKFLFFMRFTQIKELYREGCHFKFASVTEITKRRLLLLLGSITKWRIIILCLKSGNVLPMNTTIYFQNLDFDRLKITFIYKYSVPVTAFNRSSAYCVKHS